MSIEKVNPFLGCKLLWMLFFMISIKYVGAQNLVPNPSFEKVNVSNLSCNYYQFQAEFDSAVYNWVNPTAGTPDIWSSNVGSTCNLNPLNTAYVYDRPGWHLPRTGNNMAGLILDDISDEWKEYVQTKLISPMKVGGNYRVTFYTVLGNECNYACNNLGAYFSVNPFDTISYSQNIPKTPQVLSKQIITDQINWVKIDTVIKATSPWQYITIGNFSKVINTRSQIVSSGNYLSQYSYYFIDDISVVPTCLRVSNDIVLCPGGTTTLTASGKGFIGWADITQPSILISTDSSLMVSPISSKTYLAISNCDTISVSVKVATDYQANILGNDITSCISDSIILNGTIPVDHTTYLWNNGSTLSHQTVYSSGTYILKTLVAGCFLHTDSIQVKFIIPNLNFHKDTSLCSGQTLTLNAAFPGATYQWHYGYYYYGTTSTTSSYVVSSEGNYSVTLSLPNGCKRNFTTQVTYSYAPNTYLKPFQTLCPGQTAILNPISSYYYNNTGYSFQWQDGSTNQEFTATTSGTYWVKVFNGCTVYDTATVFIASNNIFNIGNDTLLCDGQVLLLNTHVIGATSYQWQDNSFFPTYTVTSQGLYSVNISMGNCQFGQSIYVGYVRNPTNKLKSVIGIHVGETIDLSAGNGIPNFAYQWQNGSTDSTYTANKEGQYWVTVTNQAGCSITDTVDVYIVDLQMPNTFTPNGDGKNDHYVPIVIRGIPTADINIQNRWGETVFQSSSLTSGWNGNALGMEVPEGVYYWLVNFIDINGTSGTQKGTFTLVR